MKKTIGILICIMTVSLLTACTPKQITGECENCGKTAPLYKLSYTLKEYTEDILCKKCADESIELIKAMASFGMSGSYDLVEYTGK